MAIEPVQFIDPQISLAELVGTSSAKSAGFETWLSTEMNQLNNVIQNAEFNVQKLASGEQDNLHQVMISLEKAKLSFELALQVRNKLLEGYQEIMRMQV